MKQVLLHAKNSRKSRVSQIGSDKLILRDVGGFEESLVLDDVAPLVHFGDLNGGFMSLPF